MHRYTCSRSQDRSLSTAMVAIWTAHLHTFIILCSHPEITKNIKWNESTRRTSRACCCEITKCVLSPICAPLTWARWRGVKRSTCTDNRSITGRGSTYIGQRESNKPPTGLPSCCLYHSPESAERNNWQGFCKSQLKIIGCLFTALYTAKSRLIVCKRIINNTEQNIWYERKQETPQFVVGYLCIHFRFHFFLLMSLFGKRKLYKDDYYTYYSFVKLFKRLLVESWNDRFQQQNLLS